MVTRQHWWGNLGGMWLGGGIKMARASPVWIYCTNIITICLFPNINNNNSITLSWKLEKSQFVISLLSGFVWQNLHKLWQNYDVRLEELHVQGGYYFQSTHHFYEMDRIHLWHHENTTDDNGNFFPLMFPVGKLCHFITGHIFVLKKSVEIGRNTIRPPIRRPVEVKA